MTWRIVPLVLPESASSVTNKVAPGVNIAFSLLTNSRGILILASAAGSTSIPASPRCPGTPILNQRNLEFGVHRLTEPQHPLILILQNKLLIYTDKYKA
jgi:hypothetical protein